MNILATSSRVLAVMMMVSLSNLSGKDYPFKSSDRFMAHSKPVFVIGTNLVSKGLSLATKDFEPKNRIIAVNALMSGAGYTVSEGAKFSLDWHRQHKHEDRYSETNIESRAQGERAIAIRAVGYVLVNGSLRLAADKCSLNEDYIDKKCDEYLSEDVAWIVKPVTKLALDFAYDYVTVELIKGIEHGINKSRNS
jgi:hypothetical protein